MVESHGSITLATLRDVNLDKRCVALPRYIVYVYILSIMPSLTHKPSEKLKLLVWSASQVKSFAKPNFLHLL